MPKKKAIAGEIVDADDPNWEPLLAFAPAVVEDFMWMFSIQLADGRRIEAYKHIWTRRYIYLDHEGGAWGWVPDRSYCRVDGAWLLYAALDRAAELCPRDAEEVP